MRRAQPVYFQEMRGEPGYWAVLRHADVAMDLAKSQGRNTAQLHDLQLASKGRVRLDLDTALHKALERNDTKIAFDFGKDRPAWAGEGTNGFALNWSGSVIADESGPVALAGVIGGAATEIRPATTAEITKSPAMERVSAR